MIIGIGSDLVDIRRISKVLSRHQQMFVERLFTKAEHWLGSDKIAEAGHYAKRFAAKEALVKALGIGFRQGIKWHDIEISNDAIGKPCINLSGIAKQRLESIVASVEKAASLSPNIHLSLSDEYPYALAMVVIEI